MLYNWDAKHKFFVNHAPEANMKQKEIIGLTASWAVILVFALTAGCGGGSGGSGSVSQPTAIEVDGPNFIPTGVDIVDPMDSMPTTIDDNVVVPPNATATLEGTVVEGNVFVLEGAVLYADGAVIKGNVQAYGASLVDLADTVVEGDVQGNRTVSVVVRENSTVGGNVQIWDANAPDGVDALRVDASTVRGNVQAEKSRGRLAVTMTIIEGNLQFVENYTGPYVITDNTISGDLQFFKNWGEGTITGNYVGGNLQSKENDPWPMIENNTVEGDRDIE